MTDKEAMAMALEALECANSPNGDYENEIAALKTRLAQEKALQALHDENARLGLYKDAYGQPEQEPVALVIDGVLVKSSLPEKYTGHLYTAPAQRTEPVIDKSGAVRIATALGWTPPRTWVGLTDDEIWDTYMESPAEFNCHTDDLNAFCAAIEAKLKEKNT